jgi:tetratricopeptide (TPR) repeat protein
MSEGYYPNGEPEADLESIRTKIIQICNEQEGIDQGDLVGQYKVLCKLMELLPYCPPNLLLTRGCLAESIGQELQFVDSNRANQAYQESRECYEAALAMDPSSVEAKLLLGLHLLDIASRADLAKPLLEEAANSLYDLYTQAIEACNNCNKPTD